MDKNSRIKLLITELKITNRIKSQQELGVKMGYSTDSAFSQVVSGIKKVPRDFGYRLKRIIPDLNLHWLETGEGEMFSEEEAMPMAAAAAAVPMAEQIPAYDPESEQKDGFIYLAQDVTKSANLDIKELLETQPERLQYRKAVDVIGSKADYLQKIATNAMSPTFQPGDLIAVQFLEPCTQIVSGAVYLVDTKSYGTMVRIVDVESETLTLRATNPDFKDMEVRKEDVYSIGLVVSSTRTAFPIENAIAALFAEIDKKDRLIERLCDQNSTLLDLVAKSMRNRND